MRDADDDEETRLFDPNQAQRGAALAADAPPLPSAGKHGAAVAPEATPGDPDDEATRIISSDPDDEPTKLVQAVGSGEWLLSRGTDPPRSVSRAELFKEIANGSLSPETYAWKDGMREWLPLREIPTLAPLLRGRARAKVPRAKSTPLATKKSDATPPQSRITAVSRSSATARAHEAMGTTRDKPNEKAQHTVTSSSARASQSAKDSTVLVSGSVPPSDSEASKEPLLPEVEEPAKPPPEKRHSSAPPRPAAGQPPSPTELIAKAPPIVTVPRSHREVTQPARSRLTAVTQLTQLASAAGRQQNLVLWLLGAAGWVVAGVLAGILIAKSSTEPAPPPLPGSPVETKSDETRSPASEPAVPAGQSEPALQADDLPTEEPTAATPPKIQPMRPRLLVVPQSSATAAPSESAVVPTKAPEPAGSGNELNSPGF